MSAHNNFSCRLAPEVLEALRSRWRSYRGGRTMSDVIDDLLREAIPVHEIEAAECRLLRNGPTQTPNNDRNPPAAEFPDYDDIPLGG